MTRLLVSVTDADEARLALAAGADVIDAKDPAAGALGALPPATILAIREAVGGRATVTAVCGDHAGPALLDAAVAAVAATGVDMVKIGFAPDLATPRIVRDLGRRHGGGVPLVAVMFADLFPDFGLIPIFKEAGFAGVMLDTATKSAGLLTHMPTSRLAAFTRQARGHGLLCGLAGSVRPADLPALVAHEPDLIGMRGGLCRGNRRTAALDPAAIRAAVAALRRPAAIARAV